MSDDVKQQIAVHKCQRYVTCCIQQKALINVSFNSKMSNLLQILVKKNVLTKFKGPLSKIFVCAICYVCESWNLIQ